MGLAGVDGYAHDTMDGRSIVPLIVNPSDPTVAPSTRAHIRREMARLHRRLQGEDENDSDSDSNSENTYDDVDTITANGAQAQSDMQLAADNWRDFHFVEYYSLGSVTRTGHLVDDPNSNTYRAIRSVKGKYGNMLYSEFTAVKDWAFKNVSFYEMFDLVGGLFAPPLDRTSLRSPDSLCALSLNHQDKDKYQLNNIYSQQTDAMKQELHELVDKEWRCNTSSCQ